MEEKYRSLLGKQLEDVRKLDPSLSDYLKKYTDDYQINQNMCLKNAPLSDTQRLLRDNIMKVFEEITPIRESITVYRGLSSTTSINLERLRCQFISVSLDKKYVEENFVGDSGCCLMVITIPAGSTIIPMLDYSHIPEEMELLLPPNGNWKLIREMDDDVRIYYFNYLPNTSDNQQYTRGDVMEDIREEKKKSLSKENEINRIIDNYNSDEAEFFDSFEDYIKDIVTSFKINVEVDDDLIEELKEKLL